MKLSKNQEKLKKHLQSQLGVTDELLKAWMIDTYPVDGDFVIKFWDYIENASKVKIVGDYDVDGICASHILSQSIKYRYPGKKISIRIPRRFTEGYGINDKIVDEIIETEDTDTLIITVDNGIAAAEPLKRLKEAGYTVIVTDHHERKEGDSIPEVDLLIDPAVSYLHNPMTGSYWCGAGVAFKLCEPILDEPLYSELETYAGLATVADCMQLKEGNWALVRRALANFKEEKAPIALTMLLEGMKQNTKYCTEDTFGFYLGPAINASGRLLDKGAIEVLKYLNHPTTEGRDFLVGKNNERKELRDIQFDMVDRYIVDRGLANTCPIWVAIPGLHEGIMGILAGKIVEKYEKPAIILTSTEKEDVFKGSGRNIKGSEFNLFDYLSQIPKDCFIGMGGHAGAAGMSMTLEGFERASKYQINELTMTEGLSNPIFPIDKKEIPRMETILKQFRPFGEGNTAPIFEVEINIPSLNEEEYKPSSNPEYLFINGPKRTYKITNFNHNTSLVRFGARGKINPSYFAGKTTPTLNVETEINLVDDREK